MTRRFLQLACLFALLPAPIARAAAPPPLDGDRFAFPGTVAAPTSAISVGLALADRWLGHDPGDNPALVPWRGVLVAPQALRVSRQDLSAGNREFTQRLAYVDLASASLVFPVRGLLIALYAGQPALRLENTKYLVGRNNSVGATGSVANDGSTRELRSGLAASLGRGGWRFGAGVELTHRSDRYQTSEVSGSPESGTRDLQFSGSALGAVLGAHWERRAAERGGLELGAVVRATGALDITGTDVSHLLIGDDTQNVKASRDAIQEFGASARYTISPESHAFLSASARGGEKWPAFSLAGGTGSTWSAGIDYRDPESPLGVRAGLGQESAPDTAEPRAGMVGAGFTWHSGDTDYDLGILHRTLRRQGAPNSSDDRLIGAVRVTF